MYLVDFVEFLIAISVTSHGDIREKLNMAFNMYGMYKDQSFFLNADLPFFSIFKISIKMEKLMLKKWNKLSLYVHKF